MYNNVIKLKTFFICKLFLMENIWNIKKHTDPLQIQCGYFVLQKCDVMHLDVKLIYKLYLHMFCMFCGHLSEENH